KASGSMPTPMELNDRVRRIRGQREIRATLAALEAAGGEARYIATDVRDRDALDAEFASIRADWGPITGVVHGAGVLADAMISKKTKEQFDRVFDTKIEGLRALLHATSADPLRALCMFSSVAARSGNMGQADYAMANEILNKVAAAESARRPDCVVKSLGWGPWEGGMVGPELKAMFEARGISLVGLERGSEAFVDELFEGAGVPIEVVLDGAVSAGGINNQIPAGKGISAEVKVDQRSYPYLDDHRIKGVPVLPVVQAMEWFARVAQGTVPGDTVRRLRNVQVRKGVLLEGYTNGGDALRVHIADGSEGKIVALEDDQALERYAAEVDLGGDDHAPAFDSPASLGPWDDHDAVYDGDKALFHGSAFQVIEAIEGIGEQGARAKLRGIKDKAWSNGPWILDAAALDGALQVALLWGLRHHGYQSLPLRVGEVVCYTDRPIDGTMACELVTRSATAQKTVSDIRLTAPDGTPLYDLKGVEMYVVASGTGATH
ncbi:MAG: SDR family oxidoreductase, partial [Myxococcota bacterium]